MRELREKNRVIVRIWLPKEDDQLTSQISATKAAFKHGNPDAYVGHVSIELPHNNYVSWWPNDRIQSPSSVVRGAFQSYADDKRSEGRRPPDRIFCFYTMDTGLMLKELETFQQRAQENDVGWTLFDNRTLRSNDTAPSGRPISKIVRGSDISTHSTDNGTSCSGLVKKLLIAGGLDKLASLPDNVGSFFARNVFSSPENITQLLESAELAENVTYPETRELRKQDAATIPISGLFQKSIDTVYTFFNNEKSETSSASDLDDSISDDLSGDYSSKSTVNPIRYGYT